MAKKPVRRRQRRPGDLPAGFAWREGRPRWVPSPARRKAGWRGVDLKDAWGRWLGQGPAIERAGAIAAAVEGWTRGEAVPAAFAAFAPRGAVTGAGPKGLRSPRSIGVLIEAWEAHPKFSALGANTQADYRGKLRRFLEVFAGGAHKVERAKAIDIDVLLPPAFGSDARFHLQEAYDALRSEAGDHMANGVLAVVSAWLGWCVKVKRLWPTNPVSSIERVALEGRIVVWEWDELVAIVREADDLGLASIGDAVILAVDLSWSQQDLLALTWGQISADGLVRSRRIKTGVAGRPPLLAIGAARVAAVRARLGNVEPIGAAPVLICEVTSQPWKPDFFRHAFAAVRAAAGVGDKQFRDLRDTAITYAYEAGLEVPEICSRTLHDPTRAQAVIQKHYGAIRQAVADSAARKLDAHFEKAGYRFEAMLALPAPDDAAQS